MGMTKKVIMTALGIAAVAGLAPLLFSPTTGKESGPKEQPRIIPVKRISLETRVAETGTLEPARTIEIKSQVSGEVKRLFVAEGQVVKPDQSLALIQQEPSEARQVAQVRASLEQERVNLEQARRELKRMAALNKKGYASRQDLESAQQTFEQARVRRDLARRQLLLALGGNQELYRRYLERALSSEKLEEFEILSPAEGTILEVKVQTGELITSGTATVGGGSVLMTIADLSRMIVQAKINEVNIGRVKVGQSVEVRLDALPGRMFEGVVVTIAPRGEKTDSIVTYDVKIQMENEEQQLRPLMTANVDILTDVLPDVIALPLEALRSDNGDDIVYVIVDGGRQPRKVRVGLRTESQAVIVHGLQEGETVVIPSFTDKAA